MGLAAGSFLFDFGGICLDIDIGYLGEEKQMRQVSPCKLCSLRIRRPSRNFCRQRVLRNN